MIDRTSSKLLKYHLTTNDEISEEKLKLIFGESIVENLDFLLSSKYVSVRTQIVIDDDAAAGIAYNLRYKISTIGRVYLKSEAKNSIHFWIPIATSSILSIIAIIVSVIALLKSS